MATTSPSPFPPDWTAADMLAQLGGVPLERIRLAPLPGTASEQDVLDVHARTDRLCELIDGVLVEKTMGYLESLLALAIAHALRTFVRSRGLGIVLGADGMLRILPRQVRIPDVCFINWTRFPGGELPQVQIPAVAPDLAVEILSPGNTVGEMQRKLDDYFAAGVRLVWYVDPAARRATAYTAAGLGTTYSEADSLSGGEVLPGFALSLRDLFAEIGPERHP
jgi:Uma2 family endonuclease